MEFLSHLYIFLHFNYYLSVHPMHMTPFMVHGRFVFSFTARRAMLTVQQKIEPSLPIWNLLHLLPIHLLEQLEYFHVVHPGSNVKGV